MVDVVPGPDNGMLSLRSIVYQPQAQHATPLVMSELKFVSGLPVQVMSYHLFIFVCMAMLAMSVASLSFINLKEILL
jgi:hypothetical protein